MAIYAISDLHLALSVDKPMDVFGGRWANYMEKLEEAWSSTVRDDDYVLIPGDISWATYLSQAYEDFRFIDSLPGKKIISKGNHDYWWTTKNQLDKFVNENGFTSISFLHNNSYLIDNVAICGTRGWSMPGEDGFSPEDKKVYDRELQRLELSLRSVKDTENTFIIASTHFPIFNSKGVFSEFLEIMHKYNVKMSIYGHLHGEAQKKAVEGLVEGIDFKLVAADNISFMPTKLL